MQAFLLIIADIFVTLITSLWFWIVLLSALLIGVIAFVYHKLKLWALGQISYSRRFSTDGVFVGESLELIETIDNNSFVPLFSVRIDFFVPEGLTIDGLSCKEYTKVTSICYLPPFSTVYSRHTVSPDRRDHYRLSTASIVYRKNEFIFEDSLDFYAYPNRFGSKVRLTEDLYHAGNAISERKYIEDPFFLSGIRPYRAGDPMRSINFKASLRSFSGGARQLVTNNYDSSRSFDSLILLDLATYEASSIKEEEQLELGLEYTCFLFCEALKNAGRVGFATNCAIGEGRYVYIPCSSGDAHTKTMLQTFAELSYYARRDFSMTAILKRVASELTQGTDVYLVTPFVDDELANLLSALERREFSVRVIPLGSVR